MYLWCPDMGRIEKKILEKQEKRESLKIRIASLWLEMRVVQMPRVSVETWKTTGRHKISWIKFQLQLFCGPW